MPDLQQQRAAVVAEGRTWSGTPYHSGPAALKGVACSCGSFILATYQYCGLIGDVAVPHFPSDFCKHTDEEDYLRLVQQHLREVGEPLPGDMAIFRLERVFAHAALILDPWPLILHVCRRGMRVSLADAHQEPLIRRRQVRFFSPFAL
jgi:hypothetical protein